MILSARQGIILSGYIVALIGVAAWAALAAGPPLTVLTARHSRHHPPLHEQEPPRWLAPLARAVLIVAVAALGIACLIDGGDSAH
jgi:hypothetical protein